MLSAISFLETKEEEFKIPRHQEEGRGKKVITEQTVEEGTHWNKMATQTVDRKL